MKVFFTDHFHDRFVERFNAHASKYGIHSKTMFDSIPVYQQIFNNCKEIEPSTISNVNMINIIKRYGANTVCRYFYHAELKATIVVILDDGKFKAVTIYIQDDEKESEEENWLELDPIERSYLVRNMLDNYPSPKIKSHTFNIFFRGRQRDIYCQVTSKSGYQFREL